MRFTHSIRWRLQLWLGLLLIAILGGFGVTAYQLQRMQVMSRIDEDLASRVSELSEAARRGPGPPREPGGGPRPGARRGPPPGAPALVLPEALEESLGGGYAFVVWRPGGEVRGGSFATAPPRPEREGRDTRMRFRNRGAWREAYHFTERGECVLVSREVDGERAALNGYGLTLGLAGLGVMLVGLGGGWWLTTRSLRPVEDMSRAALRISHGNLAERVPVSGGEGELGQLARVLNSTFERLESAFERQRQFTADASHELRTPLALMISEAQAVLARERDADEYREAVEQCLGAAQRMRELTAALLQLARIEDGSGGGSSFELGEVVRREADRLRPRAEDRGVRLEPEIGPAPCRGDGLRAEMVVANLLANALHHTPRGGVVRIATSARDGRAVLVVADSGSGIAAEDLPHVFERFYRADKSRSRTEGHFGLGLAISRAAVEADEGTIRADNVPGGGASFRVEWPLSDR